IWNISVGISYSGILIPPVVIGLGPLVAAYSAINAIVPHIPIQYHFLPHLFVIGIDQKSCAIPATKKKNPNLAILKFAVNRPGPTNEPIIPSSPPNMWDATTKCNIPAIAIIAPAK